MYQEAFCQLPPMGASNCLPVVLKGPSLWRCCLWALSKMKMWNLSHGYVKHSIWSVRLVKTTSENVLTDNLNLIPLESSLKSLQRAWSIPRLQFATGLCGGPYTRWCGSVRSVRRPACTVFGTDAIIDQQINGLAGGGGLGPLSGITSAQRGRQGSGQTALTSS